MLREREGRGRWLGISAGGAGRHRSGRSAAGMTETLSLVRPQAGRRPARAALTTALRLARWPVLAGRRRRVAG